MVTPAQTPMTLVAGAGTPAPAEPVPVAFVGRTSTTGVRLGKACPLIAGGR